MKKEYPILPLSKVRSVVGLRREKYRKVVWHTAELYVKTFLNFEEYRNLIESIIQMSSTEDGCWVYEMIDFAMRVNIIAAYSLVELPEDIDELYYVVYESDLYDVVCKNVNQEQIKSVIAFVARCFGTGER